MNSNKLEELPQSLSQLTNLADLDGLPHALSTRSLLLLFLTFFSAVSRNKLKTLPDLSALTELRELDSLPPILLSSPLSLHPTCTACSHAATTVSYNLLETIPKWIVSPLRVCVTGNPFCKNLPANPCSEEIAAYLRRQP